MNSAPALSMFAGRSIYFQQLFCVAGKQLSPVLKRKVELVERIDRRLNRAERRVGREHHFVRAEKLVAAAQRVSSAAEHRGIGIEFLKILEMRPLQRRQ